MASREPIENVYTKDGVITKNALFTIYKAEINLDKFDYDMLYAYTQVNGITLNKRAFEAEKFAQKLSEKNLDNQTIRTILETQNVALPPKSATFIEANSCLDTKFFHNKHNLFLYTQHPNLITIYASGVDGKSTYVATESLENRMPTEKLFETFTQEGKINLLIQVSRAVASLHSNKIVHQNICPENIFALPQAGGICQIKLLASGIIPSINNALDTGGGSEFKPLFAFTSPEKLLGQDPTIPSSEKEDIYALGGALYFYLSGQRPWQQSRTLFDIIKASKEQEQAISEEDLSNIPENLKSVILQATSINPDDRYSNIAQFITDLEACRDGNEPRSLALLKAKEAENETTSTKIETPAEENTDINADHDAATPTEDSTIMVDEEPVPAAPTPDPTRFKSDRVLTEQDLPQPLLEPEIPDINDISADMNKTGSQIWSKLFIAACILIVFGGIGYYFTQPDSTDNIDPTPQAVSKADDIKDEISLAVEDTASKNISVTEAKIKKEEKDIEAELSAKAQEDAEKLKKLEEERQRLLEEEYTTAINSGNKAMSNKDYARAIIEYNKADQLKNTDESAGLLQAAKIKRNAQVSYEEFLKKARELLYANKLEESEAQVLQAKNIIDFSDDPRADEIIADIRKKRFDTALSEGEELLSIGNYEDADLAFSWALSIPGYENNDAALDGRKIAQNTLQKLEQERQRIEEEKRNRLAQYTAAINEAKKLLNQGRWDEAASAYTMALDVPGFADDAAAIEGKQKALNTKLIEEKKRIEAEKNNLKAKYDTLINNGNTYLNAKMWKEAEEEFSKALEIEGYSASNEAAIGRKQAIEKNRIKQNREQYDSLLLEGINNINNENYTDAEKAFRDALLIPGFDNGEAARQGIMFAETLNRTSTRAKKYNEYLDAGKENLINKNAIGAVRDFGRAIVEAPNQIDAYILRGSAYLEAGEPNKALGNFDQALRNNPNYEPALLGRAIAFFKASDYPNTIDAFSIIAADASDDSLKALSNSAMGWIYLETDDKSKNEDFSYDNSKARAYFEKGKEYDDPSSINNLGYMFMQGVGVDKDYEVGFPYLEQAAAKGLPEAEFNLGMAYYKGYGVNRDYEKAFKHFIDAAESNTLPIAWGQVAEMYRRGRGVKKNRDLAKEYAAKFGGNTNKDTVYLASKPKIILPLPTNYLPTVVDQAELDKQYAGFADIGRKLTEIGEYESAERLYKIAAMISGHTESPEIIEKISYVKDLQSDRKSKTISAIVEENQISTTDNTDNLLTDNSPSNIDDDLIDFAPEEDSAPKTDLEDILDTLEDTKSEASKSIINEDEELLTDFDLEEEKAVPTNDISESRFGKEYVELINIAEEFLSNQKWSMAEQAFRLALALPNTPDQGDARAGLQTALTEKDNATGAGAVSSNFAAILGNATSLLKEAQWPQAIYMYKSAIDYDENDDDTLAQIGLSVAEAATILDNPVAEEETIITADNRDTASHNMAIAQSKQFLADGNFNAAIQMLEIALSMKGFEEDPVATAMLETANKMKLENGNSPEAIAMRREKNKPIYEKLIKSGELQITTGNLEGAMNSYSLALKIPGYKDDPDALAGIERIKELKNRPTITAEAKEKYNSLMEQGRAALDESDWSRAEETFRIILSLSEFTDDPDALAGLRAAAKAQNKPLPESGDISEDFLQNGLIPADADLEAIRRRAEFEALIREGKRQLELMQYEVAEAMFNEALKIEGYGNNPDGLKLLKTTLALKPKEQEIALPDHPEKELDPQQDMKRQAIMLLDEGNRLRSQKNLNKAIQAYSNGIDLDPENLQLRLNRADTNAGMGQFDLALNDYIKVLDYADADDEVRSYTWNNIANVYYYGKKDFASAVEFYKKAANVGNLASMNSLGVCYGFAKGVEKDPQQSLEWYTKAAEGGYGNAMLNLGMMYQNGWGIDTDLEQAKNWYEKATEQNVPRAFVRLSLMYANGTGVEIDQEKADYYKQKAVELGYTEDR